MKLLLLLPLDFLFGHGNFLVLLDPVEVPLDVVLVCLLLVGHLVVVAAEGVQHGLLLDRVVVLDHAGILVRWDITAFEYRFQLSRSHLALEESLRKV